MIGWGRIIDPVGPGIAQKSYEVDQSFYKTIMDSEPKTQHSFIPATKPEHFLFDLPAFCILKLQQAGVSDTMNLSEDAYQNENKYFSYRRDPRL